MPDLAPGSWRIWPQHVREPGPLARDGRPFLRRQFHLAIPRRAFRAFARALGLGPPDRLRRLRRRPLGCDPDVDEADRARRSVEESLVRPRRTRSLSNTSPTG